MAAVAAALVAPAADAGTGSAPDGIGERKAYKFEGQRVNDRVELKVNVSTGNLEVKATDLQIGGTGLDLKVVRFYNSLSTWDEAMGAGWLLGVGHDVRLEVTADAATFHAPSGYKARFDRNADGSYSTPPDPGIDAKLTRRGDGSFELEWHSKEKYVFTSAGRWTEHRDKNDNVIRFAYNAAGLVSTITDTRQRTVTFGYTGNRLTTVRDAAGGRTYAYTYDSAGRLASSAVTAYALGKDNLNLGVTTRYAYDASGRLSRLTDPRGNATTFTYDGTTRKVKTITRVTDAASGTGPTTTFTYLATRDKCSGEENAVRETRVDGPRTDVADLTSHCLDRHDRSVASFDAKGHKRASSYASNSNVAQLNESGVASGPAMDFGWSDDNQLESIKLPTGGQSSFDYGDDGNPHQPTGVRDYANTDQSAPPTWAYDYDDDGNLIEARNDGESITYRYCFNANGTVDRIAPPPLDGLPLDENTSGSACANHGQGNDTLFTYNARGELSSVDPPGPRARVTLTYDALSRVATRTDARGVRMRFTYDALDRITRIDWDRVAPGSAPFSDPDTILIPIPPDDEDASFVWANYSYDVNGNLTARHDSNGNDSFVYDALNRMTRETPEAPSASTTYSYDPAGNPTVVQASDEPRAVRYAYDNTNLVTSIVDQEARTTSFEYNKQGLRRATRYPNGVVMESRYDGSRRLTCVYAYTGAPPGTGPGEEACPSPSTALIAFSSYTYEKLGSDTNRRERSTDRDGSVTTYEYDGVSRLEKATTRNSAGTITREHTYAYDGESNLTREQVGGTQAPAETRSQAYDLDGALCWTAPGAHAASCGGPPAGATTYRHSADGSLEGTSAGLGATYSLRGHTIEVTPPGGAALVMRYTDATQDRRINVGNLRIAYNQMGLSAQAPTNSSSDTTRFVRDPTGRLVSMLSADPAKADLYYVFDGLGSVVATTDGSGAVVDRYAYEPYGEEIDPSATDRNPWRYAGGYYDKATGMLKFGARFYMPSVGRWTQRDPVIGDLNDPRGLNPYGYVGGDPINATDVSGRLAFTWSNFDLQESLNAAGEGALQGGALGLITAGPVGALKGAFWGAVGGFATTALKQVGDRDIDILVELWDLRGSLKSLKDIWRARDRISQF